MTLTKVNIFSTKIIKIIYLENNFFFGPETRNEIFFLKQNPQNNNKLYSTKTKNQTITKTHLYIHNGCLSPYLKRNIQLKFGAKFVKSLIYNNPLYCSVVVKLAQTKITLVINLRSRGSGSTKLL